MPTWLSNANLARLDGDSGYRLLPGGALRVDGERIGWLGPMTDSRPGAGDTVVDCGGRLVTPGLIDCHTHLVYAGDRAREFELRLEGAGYAEIAAAGGGIRSTVAATRAASGEALFAATLPRLDALLAEGVTTVEIKSGYGLDTDSEMRLLEVARRLGRERGVRVRTSFLGAHAVPAEFDGRADAYLDEVIEAQLPRAHAAGLVDAVDVFIESIGFDGAQAARLFAAAGRLGLPVRAHAEQLSHLGGAALAAAHGALSVDHLEYLEPAEAELLARHGTVAVLLPGAFYFLGETRLPPVAALRAHGVAIALASDANPGSSPLHSLLLILNMGCLLFGLTPAEALRGVTINAARALGLDRDLGSLEVGKVADLVLWDVDDPAMLSYRVGVNPCRRVMVGGRWRTGER